MEKVNLREKFSHFSEHWSPRIIGELNGQHVKIARVKGEFTWHHHDDEDELFLVIEGHLSMQFRDRTVELDPGEMLIVPRGVEHNPRASDETLIMMFEPASTLNTGNVTNERTVEAPDRI